MALKILAKLRATAHNLLYRVKGMALGPETTERDDPWTYNLRMAVSRGLNPKNFVQLPCFDKL